MDHMAQFRKALGFFESKDYENAVKEFTAFVAYMESIQCTEYEEYAHGIRYMLDALYHIYQEHKKEEDINQVKDLMEKLLLRAEEFCEDGGLMQAAVRNLTYDTENYMGVLSNFFTREEAIKVADRAIYLLREKNHGPGAPVEEGLLKLLTLKAELIANTQNREEAEKVLAEAHKVVDTCDWASDEDKAESKKHIDESKKNWPSN